MVCVLSTYTEAVLCAPPRYEDQHTRPGKYVHFVQLKCCNSTIMCKKLTEFFNSFIPLACAECDDSLPFSGASSTPLCYVPFPSTHFHQLVFHPLSLHFAIYFLVFLSASLFPNSYTVRLESRCALRLR